MPKHIKWLYFTVPQWGIRKGGSDQQITHDSLLSHFKCIFFSGSPFSDTYPDAPLRPRCIPGAVITSTQRAYWRTSILHTNQPEASNRCLSVCLSVRLVHLSVRLSVRPACPSVRLVSPSHQTDAAGGARAPHGDRWRRHRPRARRSGRLSEGIDPNRRVTPISI